jgi:hypothetical protein
LLDTRESQIAVRFSPHASNTYRETHGMKKRLRTMAALVALGTTIGTPAFAVEGSQTSTINRLLSYQGHTGLLIKLDAMSDLGGCGNSAWYVLPESHVHYKEIIAMLMSAKMASASVEVTVSDCHEGYGRVKHLMLIG